MLWKSYLWHRISKGIKIDKEIKKRNNKNYDQFIIIIYIYLYILIYIYMNLYIFIFIKQINHIHRNHSLSQLILCISSIGY